LIDRFWGVLLTREDIVFWAAIVSAVGTPITGVGVIYAVLSFHRRGASSQMTATSEPLADAHGRPWLLASLSVLSVILFIAALYSFHELGAASVSQAAKPLELDPAIQNVIVSMAHEQWLSRLRSQYKEAVSEWTIKKEDHLKYMRDISASFTRYDTMQLNYKMQLSDLEMNINQIAKQVGKSVSFNIHKEFDDNHSIPTEGDEKISDPRVKEDYRRLTNQYNTALKEIPTVDDAIAQKIQEAEANIDGFSRPKN
jgi:hypothetical protein